ncbi:MAG: hypothetical protein A2086_16465 [Spirochaetes bacterium GWD1_27_9]|nr:MAG: hypothetical protein A2Z98_09995 [Spirochaetes bacterium GWB1_27_13]OHD28300.1 MAG: hypothetical protein A2Y34_09805 [Spirochaetes bacterium GWC1_27_15]OHD29188.1 MAG: hypothetical protein A2086_16465 [Spirochaetes bacterium GWD1_27_9]
MILKDLHIDKTWSVFLDRDGVINKRLMADYVKSWDEFEFMPDVLTSIAGLAKIFGRIFVVTNQQGIGKKIMSLSDFEIINNKMLSQITIHNGRVDKVYFCPHLKEDNCSCRKPKIGMILQAKNDFCEIDLKKAIMVGDTKSDIQLGKNADLITVGIGDETKNIGDFSFNSLFEFYSAIILK